MIKRLIFDLDNTLIKWKDDYTYPLQKVMAEYNIKIDYHIIDNIIENLEKKHETLTREKLLNDINEECNLNLDISFVDKLIIYQKDLAEVDKEIIETLEYLSSKYELVLLTNWFKETQIGRLEKAKILKYFKEIYGPEDSKIKPNKESFYKALNGRKEEECIMIGDNEIVDIKGAENVGIKTIQVDLFNKYKNKKVIKNITELKEML